MAAAAQRSIKGKDIRHYPTLYAPLVRAQTPVMVAVLALVTTPFRAVVDVVLPPVRPNARSVVHDDGGDVYAIAGKRWSEAGALRFRVVLGEHGGDREGGLAFSVTQTGAQDISTC